jgi:hypothetical protein
LWWCSNALPLLDFQFFSLSFREGEQRVVAPR